jgi:putative tricarboxylic transport membrane protein
MFAPLLMRVALGFGPAEYVALIICGLMAAVALSSTPRVKAMAMVGCGLLTGLVGVDLTLAVDRFTFGIPQLSDGVNFAVVAIGIFGVAEVMDYVSRPEVLTSVSDAPRLLFPRGQERRAAIAAITRGTVTGSLLGVLPGSGALLSSFAAYAIEKRIAADPSRFGAGAIEGVAAPESANNAAAQTSFIPLLTLGIPSNAVMALMLGALTIHGVVPGPELATVRPDLFWGVIASMWVGNTMLLLLNLPLAGLWVKLLAIPYRLLYPAILLVSCVGIYGVSHSTFDVLLTAVFGLAGYAMLRLDFDRTAFLLGFILGPLLEENLRRAMTFAGGDVTVFVRRPVSLAIVVVVAITFVLANTRRRRGWPGPRRAPASGR